jgi:hypothetical protein
MPTAKDIERPHTHIWPPRKDKAVYCENCSTHYTEYIAQLEREIVRLKQEARHGTAVAYMALP